MLRANLVHAPVAIVHPRVALFSVVKVKRLFLCSYVHVFFFFSDSYIRSLCMTTKWDAKGGKSGATFSKTADERFVVKFITKTELQMFLDCALQ